MKERKFTKRFLACLLTAAMMLTLLAPTSVSAATTVTKRTSAVTISTGQSYHIMNNSIGTNRITSYTITITPANSRTRFDVAAAAAYKNNGTYQPSETLLRCCNKQIQIKNTAGTFVKSSASSNVGMMACISVRRGSATVQVTYKTTNKNSTKVNFVLQSSGHQALKYVKVKKGRTVKFSMTGSNLSGTPLILSGKNGYITNRTIGSKSYEKYTFNASNLSYRVYSNGKLLSKYTKNLNYDTTYSSLRYILLRTKTRNSNWMTTGAGTMTYFYPSDYVGMRYQIKTVSN